jgi:cytoskeletal protein CcmA (bactofilin family)
MARLVELSYRDAVGRTTEARLADIVLNGETLRVPTGSIVNYKILGHGNVIAYNAVFNHDINIVGSVTAGGNSTFHGNVNASNMTAHTAVFKHDINVEGAFATGGNVTINGNTHAHNINIGAAQPVPAF